MKIPLGFEIGSGRAVSVPLAHTVVTGQTQLSGKTTTLEAMVCRSGLRAVAFVTKRGESSFQVAKPLQPYFAEPAADPEQPLWLWVQSILEATMKRTLRFEESWIIDACRVPRLARSLADVHANIQSLLRGEGKKRKPVRGLTRGVYTSLNAYFELVLPQLARLPYSKTLELRDGLNVMDLGDYSLQLQGLVIRSVLEWTYRHSKGTIVIIPEAWEFIPQGRNSPVRMAAESYIRKGGALGNFLWIDSQDIAGVDKAILRQAGVWLFGVQRERHELKRTLDHIPEIGVKPKLAEVATLGKGQFIVSHGTEMRRVYVQPAWMDSELHAQAIARGEERVDNAPKILAHYREEHPPEKLPPDPVAPFLDHHGLAIKLPPDPVPAAKPNGFAGVRAGAREAEGAGESASSHRRDALAAPAQTAETENDEMWKERAEQAEAKILDLEARIVQLESALTAQGRTIPPIGPLSSASLRELDEADKRDGNQGFDALYQRIIARARRDPGVLQILSTQPEIRLNVVRETIEADGKSLRGRLALLIRDGWFDEPRNGNTAWKELQRLGARVAGPTVYDELARLAEMGFLTREGKSYQAVSARRRDISEG